ncbi:MAG: peptide chain release factor N(5)-glutamine methyltransferase [Acidobacteria bacterium]|nr:peptide chain release factor N(5)-glutamine methyltransferase [Acidobacteriota bacterium]
MTRGRTLDDLVRHGRAKLATTDFGAAPREALLLVARVLGLNEAQVLARGRQEVSEEQHVRFVELLERRVTGEPVAYLFGEREFYGRSFRVDPRVLIPRPETEHLVETALSLPLPREPWILDVGTGSGCIAVTLALELPGARLVAADLSFDALAVALDNARRLGASERIFGLRTDLAAGLDLERFDLLVSNPPYVDRADAPSLSPEVTAYEPHTALFAEDRGFAALSGLLDAALELRPGRPLLVEIGAGQLDRVVAGAEARGLEVLQVVADYASIPRTVALARPEAPDTTLS